jgi:hypothetical protein
MNHKKVFGIGTAHVSQFFIPPLLCDKELNIKCRGSRGKVISGAGDICIILYCLNWFRTERDG